MEIVLLIMVVLVVGYLIGRSSNKSPASQQTKKEPLVIAKKEIRNSFNEVIEIAKAKPRKPKPENLLPENFILTRDFENAIGMLETKDQSIFITGKAGTGKSTLLRYFKSKTKKEFVILSPTGIAAINVQGQTIHSFFKLPPTLITEHTNLYDKDRVEILSKLKMIIIDEVSMVRADIMDGIDRSLRIHRKSQLPFGGLQMVFFGDLYQLPPVVVGDELKMHFSIVYNSPYFFSAKVFQQLKFPTIELQQVFRQKDKKFIDLLNNVRAGNSFASDLSLLNTRVVPDFTPALRDLFITLSTTNVIADKENTRRLNELPSLVFTYLAVVTGTFERNSYPTSDTLVLKKGAQVMLIKNDPGRRWANGTIATIKKIGQDKIEIDLNGTIHEVKKDVWELIEYIYNKEEKKIEPVIKGTFEQYPLKLAWAVTIHKSQGQTFDQVVIDLGSGAFAHGQTYVALSRCTSFEGIILKQTIKSRDIILDRQVQDYMKLAPTNLNI